MLFRLTGGILKHGASASFVFETLFWGHKPLIVGIPKIILVTVCV